MNLKHLYYFWKAAKHGGVVRAGEAIHITPQTMSAQIKLLEESLGTPLFSRQGRSLVLTDAGRLALEYADEMFALGAELEQVIRHYPQGRPTEFRVGVSDAVPKSLAYLLLRPAVKLPEAVRIVCREWRLDRLLAELALHRLDLVISDTAIPPSVDVRAYSHRLGDSALSFLAHPELARQSIGEFPQCLGQLPLLVPGDDSSAGRKLKEWLDRQRLRPNIVGEFDDSALMTAFGREGIGVFPIPSVLEKEHLDSGELIVLGRAPDLRIEYFALSIERKVRHPCVLAITESARFGLIQETD
ncbi:MAG: transcriptional activator NhaR [Sulfuritalea sp.]|nr:transcriptional activator NhaR [Sulfuritalea sp.]